MTPNTIMLRVNSRHADPPIYEAAGTDPIMPGTFLQALSDGTVQEASTLGELTPKWVALETPYLDPRDVSTKAIDTPYADGERVRIWRVKPGDEAYALLVDEGNVAVGAPLTVTASGEVAAGTFLTHDIVGFALEAVDNTGGSGPVRIRVVIA